jgi:hypothetical protein
MAVNFIGGGIEGPRENPLGCIGENDIISPTYESYFYIS